MGHLASLTRTEAEQRGRLLDVHRYEIEVDLRGLLDGPTWRSVSRVTFSCAEPGAETFVDAGGDLVSATLNGTPVDLAAASDGRLPLRDLAAENTLVVEMTQSDTASTEGILRTVDPTDGLVYVWTSLEPDEARRLWACFDQPDLKAVHHFVVHAPAEWTVTSNTAPARIVDGGSQRTWDFVPTPVLSTYVVVVNAGPFHEIRRRHDGYDLGFYSRQSLKQYLERDVDELTTLTRQGLAYFGERFGQPFPQERYDQVFVPNLGGAMENWGCVTYGDSQLFRTPPSYAQRMTRAEFLLHEMAHQWFGDLVTMRWWDDLWLNEAFASWASCWALANATEFTGIWSSFLALFERSAYEMDLGPGSHPVRGVVDDVSQAMANFDHITYIKGQAVLHQLAAYIGEDAFVAGLRDYFAQHKWGNTVLGDLMAAFGRAAGQDLTTWTAAWLDRPGPDVLALEGSTLTAKATDGLTPRPHRLRIATYDGSLRRTASTEVSVTGMATPVELPEGSLHLVNADDLTYAVVRPDDEARQRLFDGVAELSDPLDRALVVNVANQLLVLGETAPADAASCATQALRRETEAALFEPLLLRAYTFCDVWARPDDSAALKSALADAAQGVAERQPDARLAALRTLASTATTDTHWAYLDRAIAAADNSELAWAREARRAELGDLDHDRVDRLLKDDPDPDAQVKRLKVLASANDAAAKEEVWRAFFVDRSVPASRDTLLLGAMFWRAEQAELLQPYAHRYLEELTRMTGGLLNQGVVIRAMYPLAVGDASFADAADRVAASTEDPSQGGVSNYARNQLRANTFVLRRLLQARSL